MIQIIYFSIKQGAGWQNSPPRNKRKQLNLVEFLPSKQRVASSNLVFRSYGDRSLTVRASVCEAGNCGFKSRRSPIGQQCLMVSTIVSKTISQGSSPCWPEQTWAVANVGGLGQTVNLLPKCLEGPNPSPPTCTRSQMVRQLSAKQLSAGPNPVGCSQIVCTCCKDVYRNYINNSRLK